MNLFIWAESYASERQAQLKWISCKISIKIKGWKLNPTTCSGFEKKISLILKHYKKNPKPTSHKRKKGAICQQSVSDQSVKHAVKTCTN